MIYEVVPCTWPDHVDEWRAEASDDEGCCYVAIFTGPEAERRAREYAAWASS